MGVTLHSIRGLAILILQHCPLFYCKVSDPSLTCSGVSRQPSSTPTGSESFYVASAPIHFVRDLSTNAP